MKKRISTGFFIGILILSLGVLSIPSLSLNQPTVVGQVASKVNARAHRPTVSILYPKDGAQLLLGTNTIDIRAIDSVGIAGVVIKIDGPESTNGWVDITASRTGDQYSYHWSVGIEGSYTITVRAVNINNRRAEDKVIVNVGATTTPIHDVAITSVTPSTTQATTGDIVYIYADVENQGTEPETSIVVTAYYEVTTLEPQTISSLAAGETTTLTFTWDTIGLEGTYTIMVDASVVAGEEDTDDNSLVDGTVTVSAPGTVTPTHELIIEVDYMRGHEPTAATLDYFRWYYLGNNPSGELIQVTVLLDDEVPLYPSVSDTEFWTIEKEYNDIMVYDDRGYGDPNTGVYFSIEKWVLYGTTVEGSANVVGYCYVVLEGFMRLDCLAGNYIFIADATADSWSLNNGIAPYGAETSVLMHELGHAIGIGHFHRMRGEIYCNDPYCVMATLFIYNAGNYGAWYYCDDHWATRNIDYYTM